MAGSLPARRWSRKARTRQHASALLERTDAAISREFVLLLTDRAARSERTARHRLGEISTANNGAASHDAVVSSVDGPGIARCSREGLEDRTDRDRSRRRCLEGPTAPRSADRSPQADRAASSRAALTASRGGTSRDDRSDNRMVDRRLSNLCVTRYMVANMAAPSVAERIKGRPSC